MPLSERLSPLEEMAWPNLYDEGYVVRSPKTFRYNCVAFAADVTWEQWWPDDGDSEWPIDWREVSVPCFKAAFGALGYIECGPGHEEGFEKIAIYVCEGEPRHLAKELPDGRWKSKMGPDEDIEHNTVKALEDERVNGAVACYLKKPIHQG